jgi:Fur family ferric uptake transcriptional regulator
MNPDFSLGTVEVSLGPQERFDEFLQSRGKRVTQQRRAIVEEVFRRHDHFDAEDLILHLSQKAAGRKVSRPTVYRTLSELVDAARSTSTTMATRSTITCTARSATS